MSERICGSDAQYAYDIVETICTEVGPGSPASSQERERAEIIRRELAAHLGPENVIVEEFTLAPGAFLGSLPLSGLLLLAATLLNLFADRFAGISTWTTAAAALACAVTAALLFLLEYLLYLELIDPLCKKKSSVNVIGALRKPGTSSVKRLMIVSGHHDSALENTWIRFLGYGFTITLPTMIIGFVTVLVLSMMQLLGAITGFSTLLRIGTVGWVMLAYPIVPAIIFTLFFNMGRKEGGTVPGAADNLSASALTVALCRFLVRNPAYIPAGTEIRFISFGSEEAGVRGSRRYVERHLDELQRLDARLLNLETVAYPVISILTSDVNGRVRNDPEMVRSVVAAAERAGVPYKVAPYAFGTGASDAAPFTQAGLSATTLLPLKIPQQIVAFYHQKWDRPDVLTIEPLLNVLLLACEWLSPGGE